MNAFIEAALSTDEARPAMNFPGTNGVLIAGTDGHRAHVTRADGSSAPEKWRALVPAEETTPEGDYPDVSAVLNFLPAAVTRLELNEDQRRLLVLMCSAAQGVNARHEREWKKRKKKERKYTRVLRAAVIIEVADFGTFISVCLGEIPNNEKQATIIRGLCIGSGADETRLSAFTALDPDYLMDVLETLPIAGEKTHIETPYKVVRVPAENLVIEISNLKGGDQKPVKIYASDAPETFAVIMPMRIK